MLPPPPHADAVYTCAAFIVYHLSSLQNERHDKASSDRLLRSSIMNRAYFLSFPGRPLINFIYVTLVINLITQPWLH